MGSGSYTDEPMEITKAPSTRGDNKGQGKLLGLQSIRSNTADLLAALARLFNNRKNAREHENSFIIFKFLGNLQGFDI